MARKLKSDKVLFMTTLLLLAMGIVMVYSASTLMAMERFGDGYHFVTRQALWGVLGMAVLAIAMHIDYRTYRSDAVVWTVLGIVAVALVAVLFLPPINNARRWLGFGGLGGQPSELAKLACILFTALILERRMHRIDEPAYALLPIGVVVGVLAALIIQQPDFGTAFCLMLIAGVMVFAAGLHHRHLIVTAVVLTPVMALVLISEAYRVKRLFSFIDPWADPRGAGWQAVQSLMAVGTGGVLGRGLMDGVQKLFFLPEPHTDFIFAVIGEELGLVGATAVLLCFCVIAWRGARIALRAEDAFGSFIALGITTMLAAQALIIMCVVLSLLPT
jgi:cell division protein FtsW